MNRTTNADWYTMRLKEAEADLGKIKTRIFQVSMLRLVLFVAGVVSVFLFFHSPAWVITVAMCVTFLPFFVLVKWHNRLFLDKELTEAKAEINRNELKALQGDISSFDGGDEYVDPEHVYTYDIDVFGERSVFQMLNRTCTHVGKSVLATWLKRHLLRKEAIEQRQETVKEVSMKPEFREAFRVAGMVYRGKDTDEREISDWVNSAPLFLGKAWAKVLLWGVPALNVVLLLAGLLDLIGMGWFGFVFFCFIILSFGIQKHATMVQDTFGKKLRTLNSYAKLIELTEKEEWQSVGVRQLIERLNSGGNSPIKVLRQLSRELERLDLRNNQLLYLLLEGSVFFQMRQIVRIEKWKQRYGKQVMEWLEVVGELDALCSLGTFGFNHPDYVYPTISDKPFMFEARGMGHPLMAQDKCVKNDAYIPVRPFFLIITGANMAGKSTYLRTIGVNYLLACIGCPVCCDSLELYPSQLVTSLRTSDSLAGNESYFFAEMKRLKRIIDMLNEGNELFIILDEILKGTNSTDKQKGSLDLIKQFIRLSANGIIATHDLLLGTLVDQYPKEIHNYCFEADIHNDELTFSYKLQEGVAQNMNACFIMRKMGITIDD